MSQKNLPAGMWFFSLMLGDAKDLAPEYLALGRLPAPSSLLIGIGVGAVLTAIRLVLDFAVFKVSVLPAIIPRFFCPMLVGATAGKRRVLCRWDDDPWS